MAHEAREAHDDESPWALARALIKALVMYLALFARVVATGGRKKFQISHT